MLKNKDILTGVVLMTYGSATIAEHVRDYFGHIYGDRVSEKTIQDFEHRYRLVDHSPLIEITELQAAGTQKIIGDTFVVRAGMRHSEPFIEKAIAECKAAGAERIVGIILSPQFSSFIMNGYNAAFSTAAQKHGFDEHSRVIAAPWPTQKDFIALTTTRLKEALDTLVTQYGKVVPVIFTTHSLPQKVIEKDPSYLQQLKATIDAILIQLGEPNLRWSAAYQSAGHTPEEWLKPDLTEILDRLAQEHEKAVLIVPIQFLADHLEVLYDLDIAARAQCEERTIAYHRITLPNSDIRFARALANIAQETITQAGWL
jgi:protoporphyrin/coproporphyrin ferrochelatase